MAAGYKFEWKKRSLYKCIQIMCVVFMMIIFVYIFHNLTLMCKTEALLTDLGNIRSETQHLIMLELFGTPRDDVITGLDNDIKSIQNIKIENSWTRDSDYVQKLNLLLSEWSALKSYLGDYRIEKDGTKELIQGSEAYLSAANQMNSVVNQYRAEIINQINLSLCLLVAFFCGLVIVSLPQNMKEIKLIQKNRELELAAYIDKITGLPSRRSCEEKIWMPINPRKAPYCVVIFDLNNLKKVNDEYGHHEGDRLIKGFAGILENISNDRIFAGRYGGDEFILIVHGYNEERILRLLNKVESMVANHNIQNNHPQIQYAVGYSFEGETLREMIDIADERMYINKKAMKEKKAPVVKMAVDYINL